MYEKKERKLKECKTHVIDLFVVTIARSCQKEKSKREEVREGGREREGKEGKKEGWAKIDE